jgi:hypothetical protein
MTKHLLAGISAFAMMTGVALAQGLPPDTAISTQATTSTVAPVPPVVGSYSSSKTQKTIDSNGVETKKSQSYSSGANGTESSSTTRTVVPNGSQMNSYQVQTASPTGETVTTKRTTTTIEKTRP